MLKMGIALMMINFLSGIVSTIIISFLRGKGGLDIVAFYGTGQVIITSYFGIVLTAMTTDYYPRICGVYSDNTRLQYEVNAQSKLGLIMVFPLALIFIAFASFFIPFLYSDKFLEVYKYTDWALIGTLISVPSNCIAMILLAKQDVKVFTSVSLAVNILNVFLYMGGYYIYGLAGLGIANAVNVLIQWIVYSIVIGKRFNIHFSKSVNLMLVIILLTTILSIFVKQISVASLRYSIQILLIFFSCYYALYWSRKMNIDVLAIIKNKVHKKQ